MSTTFAAVFDRPRLTTRAVVLMPVFAALVAVLGQTAAVTVPGMTVPITLQTLGVMLTADLLGPWLAAGAMALFWIATAVGLPLLSGGRGGLAVLVGPSGGYVAGWVLGAFAIGLTARLLRRLPEVVALGVANVVGGLVVVHAAGIAGLVGLAGMSPLAALTADLTFVPGDLLKAALAAAVTAAVLRGWPPARELARG